jgi:hypothetical protein
MYVCPSGEKATSSAITASQAAEILTNEFPEVSPHPIDWERLFDPNLDLRVNLQYMVRLTLAASAGRPLYTDGVDNTYAVVTQDRIGEKLGWFISISKNFYKAPFDGYHGDRDRWDYTIHLVLHDDDQAERISRALAELNPEARRFLKGH